MRAEFHPLSGAITIRRDAKIRGKGRVLVVDEDTASRYASLRGQLKRAGAPIPSNDAWIAALCLQHALPLLSCDRHFDLVKGIERIDW